MKFETIWPRHIPKGLSLTREEYRQVKRWAKTRRRRDPNYHDARKRDRRLYSLVALPVIAIVLYLVIFAGQTWLGFSLIYALILYAKHTEQRTHAPFIRRALCEAGHEVCIDCGYLLRGLPDDIAQCPECGAIRVNKPRTARQFIAREPLPDSAFADGDRDANGPKEDDYKPLPKYRWD